MADRDCLTVYVIYDHPKDFPNDVVVRGQSGYPDGRVEPHFLVRKFGSIGDAQSWLEHIGLYRVARDPSDDPCIVETWI